MPGQTFLESGPRLKVKQTHVANSTALFYVDSRFKNALAAPIAAEQVKQSLTFFSSVSAAVLTTGVG